MSEEQYPKGKMCDEDEGLLNTRLGILGDKIVLDFGKPVAWIGLDEESARQLGALLIKKADILKARNP